MKIIQAEYLTSVVNKNNILKDGIEFAFVGRSNVGKSSLINSLVGQKKLCKTSSLPGRTRMINYFLVNKEFRFVDLPGYGFAKAGKENKIIWANIMEDYLLNTKCLKRVFMLVDCRIKPTELDIKMGKFLFYYGIPTTVIATKVDKLPKSKISAYIQTIANTLGLGKDNIIPYSSETHFNKDLILSIIENDLVMPIDD
ncbi:MAG: YihA family ribosome biogenesis GTP-binding protein [Clostridiales bacterium]|nr:YihA family ribosome biogenesis GTP-binding protein [Clostridiales bacterium]